MTEPNLPGGTEISYPCPRCEDDGPHKILDENAERIEIACRNPLCKNEFEVKV